MTLTITLELTPEEEARLSKKAARAGVDIGGYLKRVAVRSGAPVLRTIKAKPKTGAELVADLKKHGIIGAGYGDPSIDSPEMAQRIRKEVWRTKDVEIAD